MATPTPLITSFDQLEFQSRFVTELPGDPLDNPHPRTVIGAAYSLVRPTPVAGPKVVAVADDVAESLGIDPAMLKDPSFGEVAVGNRLLKGMQPYAACYGGHQFGNWAGQLGDGRAIALGELIDVGGESQTLQLKGAGRTPYSRGADGLAVLRSSVREFLCSEAMHHLGVPTTRALCLAMTGESVIRDMLYDGHPKPEPGAIVLRVAPSFVRFGNFQLPATRDDMALLRALADHVLRNHFPHLGPPSPAAYCALFDEVVTATAALMVHWMRVGFVHGVMNTDNLSILGLTIDYGPYGWLEDFDPGWTPNTTDAGGKRYRFGHQPSIGHWNLVQLANAFVPLLGDNVDQLQEAVDSYPRRYGEGWRDATTAKLGLVETRPGDEELIGALFKLLQETEADYTVFFRELADVSSAAPTSGNVPAGLASAWYRPDAVTKDQRDALTAWLARYRARLRQQGLADPQRRAAMNKVNPRYVLRNYLAQVAIDQAEAGDPTGITTLAEVLRRPYDDQPGREEYAAKRPEWARHRVGCSMLSCSS